MSEEKRVELNENNFELPEPIHYSKDKDVILGIRLFNLTLARKVMKQILNDQEENKQLKEKFEKRGKILDEVETDRQFLADNNRKYRSTIYNIEQRIENYKSTEKMCSEQIEKLQDIPITGVVYEPNKLEIESWYKTLTDTKRTREDLEGLLVIEL